MNPQTEEPTPAGPEFRQLAERMKQLAERGKSVLVFGPTGTGKELLLRTYVDQSRWNGKATIINCAAFPPMLLDSELFGHKKGAFTDAAADHPGLIQEYDCIGLDEIGDAPPDFQARVLRVIQFGEYRPVGEAKVQTKRVTFIAATNKVEALRHDLLWRFNARIFVPALRDRGRDLVEIFDAEARKRGMRRVTERCVRFLLEEYPWPGNVREMQFTLDHAAEFAGDEPVDLRHLPMGEYKTVKSARGAAVGRVWSLDDGFVHRAENRFNLPRPRISGADFQYALLSEPTEEIPEPVFRSQVASALDSLATVAQRREEGRLAKSFEGQVTEAPTPDAARLIAEAAWYKARLAAGKRVKEIAAEAEITSQAVGARLRKLRLRSQPA